MKFLINGLPGSITGTFLILYFESNRRTVSIELSEETGRKGAHRNDLMIECTYKTQTDNSIFQSWVAIN